MSSLAAWSYTATATHWPRLARDGWSHAEGYAAPVTFVCDYASTAKQSRDPAGLAFTTNLLLFTERDSVKPGDRILLGASTAADPIAAGAIEVRQVLRNADTFERARDDYELQT